MQQLGAQNKFTISQQETTHTSKNKQVKNEQKFDQLIKWAQKNRRRSERYNNKIKKAVIEQEYETKNFEIMKRKPVQNMEQEKGSKAISSAFIYPNASRRGSILESNIKQLDQLSLQSSKASNANLSNSLLGQITQNNPKQQSKESNPKRLSKELQELNLIDEQNELQNNSTYEKKQKSLKKKEDEDNEFRLQIRREMMVDDSIGGKLSYKLMLKMEQFFEHYQLKNPKQKQKIINHLHYEQDVNALQLPVAEQEGAYKDDKDFIRRDDYWSNLFAKQNEVYSLRTPDEFKALKERDLTFPKDNVLVDINISETIQDKMNSIKIIRINERIEISKQRKKQREEIAEKLRQERMQQQTDQSEQDMVLLEIDENNAKRREKMQDYDYSIEDNNQLLRNQTYSITNNNNKTNQNKQSSFFGSFAHNVQTAATATETQDNFSKLLAAENITSSIDKNSLTKKRNHALELDEIEIDSITSLQELKKKKNAINRLYLKLFPQQIETNNNQRMTNQYFQQTEELPLHQIQLKEKQGSKYLSQMSPQKIKISSQQVKMTPQQIKMSPQQQIKRSPKQQILLSPQQQVLMSISSSSQMKSPSQQVSRQSSSSQNQSQMFQQQGNVNQPIQIQNQSNLSQRKQSSVYNSQQKEKIKQKLQFAPAKLQKQYQTYFKLSNVPYMSEIGIPLNKQIQQYAKTLEEYCPNPFENIAHLNEIIDDHTEYKDPELVKKKIFKERKPVKPRFQVKNYDEIELLQKKVNFQYRDQDKIQKLNIVDDNQDQIISHNIQRRIKSFSSNLIKRSQINFYKEKSANLTEQTKQEFNKAKEMSRDLQKLKINETKKAKYNVRTMKNFSQKCFMYTPQEEKQIKYNFPPYPLQKQEDEKTIQQRQRHIKIAAASDNKLRVQTASKV